MPRSFPIQLGCELRVKVKNQSLLVIVVKVKYEAGELIWADVVDDEDNKYRITNQEIESILLTAENTDRV